MQFAVGSICDYWWNISRLGRNSNSVWRFCFPTSLTCTSYVIFLSFISTNSYSIYIIGNDIYMIGSNSFRIYFAVCVIVSQLLLHVTHRGVRSFFQRFQMARLVIRSRPEPFATKNQRADFWKTYQRDSGTWNTN